MLDEKTLTKRLRTIFGAHHYVHVSEDTADIAAILNLPREQVENLMRSSYWRESLDYWGFQPELGDLKIAQQLWAELVGKDEHINPVEYPLRPDKAPQGEGDLALYPLIQSHLFCVDNLSKREMRKHYESVTNKEI